MKDKILTAVVIAALLGLFPTVHAEGVEWGLRAGYNVGGTTPLGLPASIRSIDAFRLCPSPMLGADITIPLSLHSGQSTCSLQLTAGLRFENKGMDAEITVKGYSMEMRKGDSQLGGLFTGHVKQQVDQWMVTLPVTLQLQLTSLDIRIGPYLSVVVWKDFSGIAFDGYLRQGTPTGPKVEIGDKEGEWATYDFSADMRRLQWGLCLGVDWHLHPRFGLAADLTWGLTGIFHSDFKTVEQTLYPIYGTVGLFYNL